MPILRKTNDDDPLTQGDILKGLPLFVTDKGWAISRKAKAPACMVVSRPCVVSNKPQIVVAAVERVKVSMPRDLDELAKVRRFLEQLRDGVGSPDRFYLGQNIPGLSLSGRFFARLDSLHTVDLPSLDDIGAKLSDCRLASLTKVFQRDLHRRIFSAFATMGFDNLGWYSDPDLKWIVAIAETELIAIRFKIANKDVEIAKNNAAGNEKWNEKLAKEVDDLRSKEQKICIEMEGYKNELTARSGDPASES